MNAPAPSIRLLVCGSADRGDDGAAVHAVAHLLPRLEAGLRRQLEIRRPREVPGPVAKLALQLLAGEPPALPDRPIGVLQAQG